MPGRFAKKPSPSPPPHGPRVEQRRSSPDPPRPAYRVSFGAEGALAIGRRPQGGILTKRVSAVDLVHLGVDRLQPTPFPGPASAMDEEAWCRSLQLLGAQWWRSLSDLDHASNGIRPMTDIEKENVFVGWMPDGRGVWMLEVTGPLPADFGRYDMCLNMEERCEVLNYYGATFYPDPREWEALTDARLAAFQRQRDQLEEDFGEFSEGNGACG